MPRVTGRSFSFFICLAAACADDERSGVDAATEAGVDAGMDAGLDAGDACERAKRAYTSFIDTHNQCTTAADCVAVAGRSSCTTRSYKFAAVNRSHQAEAERLSVPPDGCYGGSGGDGPIYGAATCSAGRCQPQPSGICNPPPQRDAGSDAGDASQ